MNRPYLVLPKLIEQPTWGGDYILKLKNWAWVDFFKDKKIGQSYELYGSSLLAVDIRDSANPKFASENTRENIKTIPVSHFFKGSKGPLLIKINQAFGNSFQLHIKPETKDLFWKPKPESWYFLEDGYISLGIKPETDVIKYQQVCVDVESFMYKLQKQIQAHKITVPAARAQVQKYIQIHNPHQFVQLFHMKKHDVVDLSMGAIHHSWEEHKKAYPQGNIIFEVQLDVMDDVATIRCFDQGNIKDDGSVRSIHIDDYFTRLDTDPQHNALSYLKKTSHKPLISTPFYVVDLFEISDTKTCENTGFTHLYVRDGDVKITAGETAIRVTQGHSCCVPQECNSFHIDPLSVPSAVLQTRMPSY